MAQDEDNIKDDKDDEVEEIQDLNQYEDEVAKKVVKNFVSVKEKRRNRMLEDVQEMDVHIKYGMTLILNYWAENGQFNQNLLEDLVPLIAKRSTLLRKFK